MTLEGPAGASPSRNAAPRLILGPWPGLARPDSVRIWLRMAPASDDGGGRLVLAATPRGGGPRRPVTLVTRALDGGCGAVDVPLAGEPGTLHDVTVATGSGQALAALPVRSAPPPSRDGRIAFAFGSCWRPESLPDAGSAWRLLAALARARHVDHLLLLGDQVYADQVRLRPSEMAVSRGPTAVRAVLDAIHSPLARRVEPFRDLYQGSLRDEAVREGLAALPSTCTWDDHEIANGWGSAPWHHGPAGRAVFEAAAKAYDEFQGARNGPSLAAGTRAHAFRRGPAWFLTLDLRGARDARRGVLLGDAQRAAVEAFLAGPAREAPLLLVACSVPPFHVATVPGWLGGFTDAVDQWSSGANRDERRWLLGQLLDYEEGGLRRAVLLGGDAHLATLASARGPEGRALWQVTSSPLGNRLPPAVRWALSLLGDRFEVPADGVDLDVRIHRRWMGPNLGVIRGEVRDGRAALAFELFRPGRRTIRKLLA